MTDTSVAVPEFRAAQAPGCVEVVHVEGVTTSPPARPDRHARAGPLDDTRVVATRCNCGTRELAGPDTYLVWAGHARVTGSH